MRLTERNNTRYLTSQKYFPTSVFENKNEWECAALVLNKLGQLEDIEEELGIDLITLFKALQDSIAIKNEDGTITVMWACPRFQISLDRETAWILYGPITEQKVLYIKDYGKTWALRKEELL